jgi:hypothetical protein
METGLYSGKTATTLVPFWRASVRKCASGIRVSSRFAPISMMYLELNQSADSQASVCTPQVRGSPGQVQYQS